MVPSALGHPHYQTPHESRCLIYVRGTNGSKDKNRLVGIYCSKTSQEVGVDLVISSAYFATLLFSYTHLDKLFVANTLRGIICADRVLIGGFTTEMQSHNTPNMDNDMCGCWVISGEVPRRGKIMVRRVVKSSIFCLDNGNFYFGIWLLNQETHPKKLIGDTMYITKRNDVLNEG